MVGWEEGLGVERVATAPGAGGDQGGDVAVGGQQGLGRGVEMCVFRVLRAEGSGRLQAGCRPWL